MPIPLGRRPVARTLVLLLATMALGLATRQFPNAFPVVVARYGGDALWAALVFWLLALSQRSAATLPLALGAIAIAWAVECSQLYHAPWIDAIRATRVGALILGQGFLWSDLACYVVGVAGASVIDRKTRRS